MGRKVTLYIIGCGLAVLAGWKFQDGYAERATIDGMLDIMEKLK